MPPGSFPITDYGAQSDPNFDNSAACESAAAAASAYALANPGSKGRVWIPSGYWGMGEDGANRVYSGCKIQYDNVIVDGEKDGALVPRGNQGNYALVFCKTATDSQCGNVLPSSAISFTATAANPVVLTASEDHLVTANEYIYIWGSDQVELNDRFIQATSVTSTTITLGNEDGRGRSAATSGSFKGDVEPLKGVGVQSIKIKGQHLGTHGETGHSQYYIVRATPSSGSPERYQAVTISGATNSVTTGTVAWYDSTQTPPAIAISGQIISSNTTAPAGSSLTFTGPASAWSVSGIDSSDSSEFEGLTTEGDHGIYMGFVVGGEVSNTELELIADEAVDIVHSDSVILVNNYFNKNGQEEEGGSGVSINASRNITVTGNECEGGNDSVIQNSSCFALSTNTSKTNKNIVISSNTIYDDGIGKELVEDVFSLACSITNSWEDLVIRNNVIRHREPNSGDTSTSYEASDDKLAFGGSGSQPCEYTVRDNEIIGWVYNSAQHDGVWENNDYDIEMGTLRVNPSFWGELGEVVRNNEFDALAGGSTALYAFNLTNTESGRTVVWRGNDIDLEPGAITLDCLNLFNGGYGNAGSTATFDYNTFDTCGGGAVDHAIEGTGPVTNVAITNNAYNDNNASAGFRIELTGTPVAPCYDGPGSGSGNTCSGNTVEN